MGQRELCQAKEKELKLAEQDKKMKRTKEKKNALKAYVNETRKELLNTYRSFVTDSEKDRISRELQQTKVWLDYDRETEDEDVFTERLQELKKMVDPIENRYKEQAAREQATRNLLNCKFISTKCKRCGCNKAGTWLQEKKQQQHSLPKTADPILWSTEITRKTDALHAVCKHVMESNDPGSDDDMQAD